MTYLIIVLAFYQFFIVILIFIFVNYNLQGPTENRQGEWVPWINIIIILLLLPYPLKTRLIN